MNLLIGYHRLWDAMCYPRIGWPLSEEGWARLIDVYATMVIGAYMDRKAWSRSGGWEYHSQGMLIADQTPPKVWVVLGFFPEKITWPGEWAPYRVRIDLLHPLENGNVFAMEEKAEVFAREYFAQFPSPHARYKRIELEVIRSPETDTAW